MSFVVMNQSHFNVPVAEIEPEVARTFPEAFRACPGFREFFLVQTAPDIATALIVWETAEDAARGAAIIGPTVFAQVVAPHLASEQVRAMGPAVVEVTTGGD